MTIICPASVRLIRGRFHARSDGQWGGLYRSCFVMLGCYCGCCSKVVREFPAPCRPRFHKVMIRCDQPQESVSWQRIDWGYLGHLWSRLFEARGASPARSAGRAHAHANPVSTAHHRPEEFQAERAPQPAYLADANSEGTIRSFLWGDS
jgi:hypothetical protein